MEKLVDWRDGDLGSGCVFRFPGQWPHEAVVDLLLVTLHQDGRAFGLVVATGHKAGSVLVVLPSECESSTSRGVKHEWLVENWSTWVYPDCAVKDVWLMRRYPVPALPV